MVQGFRLGGRTKAGKKAGVRTRLEEEDMGCWLVPAGSMSDANWSCCTGRGGDGSGLGSRVKLYVGRPDRVLTETGFWAAINSGPGVFLSWVARAC